MIKKDGYGTSSVIKIVKIKYSRIDIKRCLVSTSFKYTLEFFLLQQYSIQMYIFSCSS